MADRYDELQFKQNLIKQRTEEYRESMKPAAVQAATGLAIDRYESWIWLHRVEDGWGYTVKDRTLDEVVARSCEIKDFATTEADLDACLARLRNPQ